ncbi:ABC transporter permease [Williamsia sp. CHRR-6]|uniref:ABC transporter permease n=1 Tax=Williamsia sp. CHRR-6 TaxID=2835871 RepID=UPI001BD9F16D|nr:ABC transporter permease [Williamsia sp. CHRR-6]MBT0566317.1 ABC transporter permease [Williamsia sp. CHRR-6]
MTVPAADPSAQPSPIRPPSRSQIPGLALIRSTSGLQRYTLISGLVLVAIFIILAVFAPLIAPYSFKQQRDSSGDFPSLAGPSGAHWFGTTVGQLDVFSRTVYGARTALIVIVLALLLSVLIGVALGLVSGYAGGWFDRVVVTFMDAMFGFPSLLLAIVVSASLGPHFKGGFGGIMAAAVSITVVFIPQYYRVIRNATLSVKTEPFVDAARVTGAGPARIAFVHILPNVTTSLPVIATLNCSEAILTLAGLGFLGLGIEPTAASEWGYDLNRALPDVANGLWWTSVFPGMAIVLIVLGITMVGESINEATNPLLRTRRLGKAAGGTDDASEVAS